MVIIIVSIISAIVEPAVAACPSLPVFNIRQHITRAAWANDHSATIWVCQSPRRLVQGNV